MNYIDIVQNIKNNLTFNVEKDRNYLKEEMKKHFENKEIARFISESFANTFDPDYSDEIDPELLRIEDLFKKAHEFSDNNDIYSSLNIIRNLVVEAEELLEDGFFKDDETIEFRCFTESFQLVLYTSLFSNKKIIIDTFYPFSGIFFLYGALLMDLQEFELAKEYLEKAFSWAPCDSTILKEYCESLKEIGDLESFRQWSLEGFKIAYKSKDLAGYYKNLGYYYLQKEMYQNSVNCYVRSLSFEESKITREEIKHIFMIKNSNVFSPNSDDFDGFYKEYRIPKGADEKILVLLYSLANTLVQEHEKEQAKQIYEILYDLTDNSEIKEILDELEDEKTHFIN